MTDSTDDVDWWDGDAGEGVEYENAVCDGETDRAIHISGVIDRNGTWVPKSCVHDDSEVYQKGDKGTLIIKNALGDDSKVYSLDLPNELAHISLQHPKSEGKINPIGSKCNLEYEQIFVNSLEFDYTSIYPLDGAYIDGEHIRKNVLHESKEMIKADCEIIIYHDADIVEVYHAIEDSHSYSNYTLYKVENTRIAYAIRNH